MSALQDLLNTYRKAARTEREKGTYFEELIRVYLRHEPTYRDLYSDVWTWADWAKQQGIDARDTGIDLVAKTQGTDEFHAIQCKLYAEAHQLSKKDIDSFFTASGKKPFTHRLIVATTDHWGEHAEDALRDQQTPVSRIDLHDLENSVIDWSKYQPKAEVTLKPRKTLRPHQENALKAVTAGLQTAERGKLIMACGTGKTFTSLKIAEAMAGKGGRVLFLVPSLSLLSQTLTEWTQESETPLHNFAVCSDAEVGKKRRKGSDDDAVQTQLHELRYPATTRADRLAAEVAKRHDAGHMSVVYSTYHSIEVIADAQAKHGLPPFDLIVCDEAHRTTGAKFEDESESAFIRVHDGNVIRAARRLYMTATPRIYGDAAKAVAERDNVALYSMDNEDWYGRQLFVITFSEAVKRGLLVDYKVIVLAVEESHINRRLQKLLAELPRALCRQPEQGAAAHPARAQRRRLLVVQPSRPRAGGPAPPLRDGRQVPADHRDEGPAGRRRLPRREDEVRQEEGPRDRQERRRPQRGDLQRQDHHARRPGRSLGLHRQRQGRPRLGDGTPGRPHRQGQRHRQRRQRLGHRDHG
jgi:predicted helicase